MTTSVRAVAAAAMATLGACGADGNDAFAPDGTAAVRALFEVPRAAPLDDFYALPFPSDIRRAGDRIDLTGFPRPNALIELYVDAAAALDGFGLNAAVHLRFSGAIDPDSLPATAAASLEDDAAVYLVDVDPDSPARGERVPVRLRFDEEPGSIIGPHWLAALPFPGFPLAEGTTYALVVTRRIEDSAGAPIGRDADFAALAGDDAGGELAAAAEAYAPLWGWLDEDGGDDRDDVVSAAVFTTQRATAIVGALREVVYARPAPRARNLARATPPDGVTGLVAFTGVVDAPNFQRGAAPYNQPGTGDIVTDDDGAPVVQRTEALRLSISVPARAAPASGWPVAIIAHGTGGDYQSHLRDGTAERLAAQGIAAISTDQVLHGPRSPGASPEVAFFNFENPQSARDNPIQGAVDDFTLTRLVDGLTVNTPSGTARFDPQRIYFFGHSQGGLTGPPFVAFEPAVRGAVLSGSGGLLYHALLDKTEPIDIRALVELVIPDQPLDEFNPVLALLQTWIERSDAVNYGAMLVRRPAPGLAPRPVFHTMGLVDHFTPLSTLAAMATAIGGNQVAPVVDPAGPIEGLALRGRPVVPAPVEDNLGGVTAVTVQYRAPAGEDGHFVVFDVAAAQTQSIRFLSTLAATGTATVVEAR